MPVPTAIGDLSQTAGSNSPAGTESPITADNYFRAHAAFIAQLQAEKAPIAAPTFTGLVTTAGQVKFPATQNASSDANTLDDYEEGTWTPAFTASGCTFAYTTQEGYYTKIGKLVTLQGQIVLSTGNTLASADLKLSGLPFAAAAAGPAYVGGGTVPNFLGLGAGIYGMTLLVLAGASDAEVWVVTAASSNSSRANASVQIANSASISFFLSYRSAN